MNHYFPILPKCTLSGYFLHHLRG